MAAIELKFEKFQSPGKGNGLRATSRLSPGDLVYIEEPFAYTVNQNGWGKVCEFCLCESPHLLQCSRCKFAKYCGKRCQTEAWPDHKKECKCLKSVESEMEALPVRVVGKIILKLHQKKPCLSEELYSVSDLVSNFNEQNEERKITFECLAVMLHLYLRPEIPDLSQLIPDLNLLEYFAKAFCNQFMIISDTSENVADGLYLTMSLLNHSCEPNCVTVFKGRHLHLRAIQEIQVGEELTTTYIDPLMTTVERQSQLRRKYCFQCDCRRCQMHEEDDKMLSGDKKASEETKDVLNRVKEMQAQEKWSQSLALCKVQLKKNIGHLPDENIYQLKILSAAMDACMPLQMARECLQYGLRVLEPYRLYYSGFSLMRAFHLRKVGKMQCIIGNKREGRKNLIEALDIMKIVYGQDHRETQELMGTLQSFLS
ncbi:hypothetical protein NDU88_004753 [Pleurodeles waltl]|uniref:[histone H3]-lysine(4) N-trimethyltransferase n=1 Tax=Pleurodeles waltl TaxID=8319 RepID=A0AAV7QCW0_PLEWA|nr:hypothetical protein NDU88_004753 [Pleurodeles waltl]